MAISTTARSTYTLTLSFLPMAVALTLSGGAQQSPKQPEGQKLFLSRCSHCHGANGQGGSADPQPLAGTLSAKELASFIKKSMPPGPKKCPPEDADKIAAYIYDAFFSPLAQERIRPARMKLVHLTVRQFKNAVSDLVTGYHSAIPYVETHGLHAEYFKSRSRDAKNRAIDRIDPEVRFDFGTDGPAKEQFDPRNFSIVWQGSIFAPDSGEYEFSIHSRHSVQLWINGSRYPVVDGEVRSAGDPDPHGTMNLLGGRSYGVYMVFTKATQGVDDTNKKNAKPVEPSFVTLNWRRPKHVLEPVPTQFLYKDYSAKSFVPSTPFPPDDRSMGYERGDGVSKEWDDATTAAALEAAEYVTKNLSEVSGIPDNDPNRDKRLRDYCSDFLRRAFRHPISDDLKATYIDKQFRAAATPEAAVKRVVVLALKSPRFLFREIGDRKDPFTVASQLSFGLWDTIPDPELIRAATTGELSNKDSVVAQATRLANDHRAWSKLRDFLLLWLKVDEVPDITKNPKEFPEFSSAVASDLRTSLELFLENTAWSKSSDYRDFFQSDTQFLNGRLSKIYGASLPADSSFQQVPLDPDRRAGVITHPYLLSRFAYLDSSSPIHRGVLVLRNLLGRVLSPPPASFVPLGATARPDLTTRERVALQTKPEFCNNCHSIINPLGYTLESFDAIGRIRDKDHGKPVDASGTYRSKTGTLVQLAGAQDLAKYLATSDDAHSAFISKLFVHVAKQPPLAYGPTILSELQQSFAKNQYSIRRLLVDSVVATAIPSTTAMPSTRSAKL